MSKVITQKQFSLNWRDFLKGLLMAVLMPVLLIVQQSLDQGSFVLNWKQITMAAMAGLVGYLIKNFFTPTQVVIKADDPEAAQIHLDAKKDETKVE